MQRVLLSQSGQRRSVHGQDRVSIPDHRFSVRGRKRLSARCHERSVHCHKRLEESKEAQEVAEKLCLQAVMPIQLEGDIPTNPQDILPLMFAEFRGPILSSVGGSDRWVETEAKWSKD